MQQFTALTPVNDPQGIWEYSKGTKKWNRTSYRESISCSGAVPVKKCLALLFMAMLCAAGVSIASSEYDWVMVRDEDGIQVYLKEYWADKVKAFKGVVQIEASIDSLLAVITDLKACTAWIHHCETQELLLRQSFSECYHYQLHHLPFPARNREFIFHTRIRRIPETGEVNIEVQALPEFCTRHTQLCKKIPRYSAIRVQHSHGTYHLEPLGKKLTRIHRYDL